MRAKGYSDTEAADRILVQQVRRESQKNKPNDTPCPESAAASSLLALAMVTSAASSSRPALRTITPNLAAAPVVTVAGMDAGILPSPERKVRKTSHQEQIGKQNESKRKAVHAQAHARATTLVAEERAFPKEDRRSTAQVIAQVEGEFRARGLAWSERSLSPEDIVVRYQGMPSICLCSRLSPSFKSTTSTVS